MFTDTELGPSCSRQDSWSIDVSDQLQQTNLLVTQLNYLPRHSVPRTSFFSGFSPIPRVSPGSQYPKVPRHLWREGTSPQPPSTQTAPGTSPWPCWSCFSATLERGASSESLISIFPDAPCRDSDKQEPKLSVGFSLGHSLQEIPFMFPPDSWSLPQILLSSGQEDGSGTQTFH